MATAAKEETFAIEESATSQTDHRLLGELIDQLEAVDITALTLMSRRSSRERLMSDMDHE